MTREANGLVSLPVLDTSSGTQLGRVKDVLFDTEAQTLYGLLVTAPSGEMFLEREGVKGFGADAVTVESAGAITPVVTQPRAQELMDSGIRLRGSKVVTETGDAVGTLDKIIIEESGEVAGYEATTGLLGLGRRTQFLPSQVRTIGTDAIVVTGVVEDDATTGEAAGRTTRIERVEPLTGEGSVDTNESSRGSTAAAAESTPAGTDPNKETVVASPDSQPGNLVEDELKERAG